MKITCTSRRDYNNESDYEAVEAGLFKNKKKKDSPLTMEEYIDKVNKAGDALDKVQQRALKKYGKSMSRSAVGGGVTIPGPGDFDVPDYDPIEADEVIEYINVLLDADIIIAEDGSWDYVDDECPWAHNPDTRRGEWYSEEYPDVLLADGWSVVENVDELMMDMLPDQPGRYHVSGNVNLYYSIIGVEVERDFYTIEDGDPAVDETFYTDDADVYYVKEESTLEDFECSPIDSIKSSTAIQASSFNEIPGSKYWFRELAGGDIQVSMHRPYDDADYFWAKYKASQDAWLICKNGKVHYHRDPVNIDPIDDTEWIADTLKYLNDKISPRMIHN